MNRMKRNASVTVLNGNFQQNHTNTRNIASRTEKRCISMSVKRLHNSFMLLCPKRDEKKLLFFRWSASIFYFHFFCSHFFFLVAVQRTLYSTFRYGFGAWKEAFFNRHTFLYFALVFSLCVSAIFPEHSKKHNKYKIGEQYQNNSQLSCCEKWLKIFWLSIYNWSASYLFVFCKFFFFAANFGVFRNSVVLQIKISVAHVPFFLVSFRFEIFRQGILLYELNGI